MQFGLGIIKSFPLTLQVVAYLLFMYDLKTEVNKEVLCTGSHIESVHSIKNLCVFVVTDTIVCS